LLLAPLTSRDAKPAAALHARCFDKPWEREDFRRFAEDAARPCFTARDGRRLSGFVLASLAADEGEILSLCVAPECRRRGIGSALLERLREALIAHGTQAFFLEVNAQNHAAIRLYEKAGFRAAGKRPAYYQSSEGPQDALIMRLSLPPKIPARHLICGKR
jgi:ribosomal-protein-alanine N-acetyltransferase